MAQTGGAAFLAPCPLPERPGLWTSQTAPPPLRRSAGVAGRRPCCRQALRHSLTAVSAPWQKLQGCIPLPPARIPHRLHVEEGPRRGGGRHPGVAAAGWRFWKSGLRWVWDQALRQRE